MLEQNKLYRWVTTSTDPVIIDSVPVEKNALESHQALAKKKKLAGKVLGGFLKLGHNGDYEFAGHAKTVQSGNEETLQKAINERGVEID